jgi:hypothetical protein
MHEITHTLVFSIVNAYTDYWTVNEVKYSAIGGGKDITKPSNFRGVASTMIVTDTVVQKA